MITIQVQQRDVLDALQQLARKSSDLTPAMRNKRGKWPGPKLQVSGQMAASLVTAHGKDFAQVGTNKVYAAMQQGLSLRTRGKRTLAWPTSAALVG